MIRSFACKETKKIFEGKHSRKLPGDIQETASRKMTMLEIAALLSDLKVPPNNQLEALKDDRKGQHSIRINRQWRICFMWTPQGPERVEIVDYH